MSEAGKRRAMNKTDLPPDGKMFAMAPIEQLERRACQAFLKMLTRDERKKDDSFVNWVDYKASIECGTLYSIVHQQAQRRLAINAKLRASQKANEELKESATLEQWKEANRD